MKAFKGMEAQLSRAAAVVLESLEQRVLLASGMGDEKHGPLAKLAGLGPLRQEYLDYVAAHGSGVGFVPAEQDLILSSDGLAIQTYVNSGYSPKTLLTKLQSRHLHDASRSANGVAGVLPWGELSSIALLGELSFAQPLWVKTNVGAVTSQGDAAIRSDVARATYGYDGTGQTVGVISDSFNTSTMWSDHYANDVTSGDLPSGVNVVEDLPAGQGQIDEGRAMAQLVHDGAPGAKLAFATAFVSEADFANNITALRTSAGASVIVDDVSYFDEPMFEDGPIAQAVDAASAAGVPYFSAAANEGSASYQSAFRTGNTRADGSISGNGTLHFFGGVTHNFATSGPVDDMQQFTLAKGSTITLSFQWDQPYGSIPGSATCQSDVDIYILNSTGTKVLAAASDNNVGGDPTELIQYTNPSNTSTTFQLMVCLAGGAAPGLMKYVNFGSGTFTEYNTNSSTLFGHANASTAAAVAAAAYWETPAYGFNPPVVESYSSLGGTPILFDTTGTRLGSPITRQEPKFTGADGGNTTFFYSDDGIDFDTFPNFYGTSAAAPTTAAVAALIRQANPSLTPAQIITTLQNSALDMNTAGYDFLTGSGLVRADVALKSVAAATITGQAFVDTNSNAVIDGADSTTNGVSVFVDANNNGVLDNGTVSQSSTDVPKTIADLSTSTSSLTVSGATSLTTDVNVTVSISHNNDANLDVFLISPLNQRVELFSDDGGSGHNFTGTTLDDQASTSMTAGTAPFTGSFRPEGTLSDVNGINPNGTWKLEVTNDGGNGLTGTLTAWSLAMTTAELSTTTAGSGNYTFAGVVSGAFNLRQVIPVGFIQTAPATAALSVTTTPGATSSGKNFGDFPVVYSGTSGSDTYNVSLLANGTTEQIVQSSPAITYTIAKTALASTPLKINPGASDDSLTVSYLNGNPVPSGGLFYDGGAGNDTLTINGSSGADVVTIASAFSSPTAGAINVNDPTSSAQTVEGVTFNGGGGSDTLNMDTGTYAFDSDLSAGATNLTLNVNNTGTSLTLNSSQHLAALSIANGLVTMAQNGSRLISTGTLDVSGTGKLDLKDNDLIVQAGSLGTWNGPTTGITRLIADGYHHGAWDGNDGIITSQSQALALRGRTTLGVALASDALNIGTAASASWEGETVTGSAVLVKYTYMGDANLSGKVDGDDYAKVDQGFAAHSAASPWASGDFTYDGLVNADDYFWIDQTYSSQGGQL